MIFKLETHEDMLSPWRGECDSDQVSWWSSSYDTHLDSERLGFDSLLRHRLFLDCRSSHIQPFLAVLLIDLHFHRVEKSTPTHVTYRVLGSKLQQWSSTTAVEFSLNDFR